MTIYALVRQKIFSKVTAMDYYPLTQIISKFNLKEDTHVSTPKGRFKRYNEGFQKALADPEKFFDLPCMTLEQLGLQKLHIQYDVDQSTDKSRHFHTYNNLVKATTPVIVGSFLSTISCSINHAETVVQKIGDLGGQFSQNVEVGISG